MLDGVKISVTPRVTRYILIDFDNVTISASSFLEDLQTLVTHVVNRLMEKADFLDKVKSGEHIKVRLYGGWFDGNKTTRQAQDITAGIGAFPIHLKSPDRIPFEVDCERADRMLAQPNEPLYCTYREVDFAPKLDVRRMYCCEKGIDVSEYLNEFSGYSTTCPSCKKRWKRPLLLGHVQKMVDAMIFCDLNFLLRDIDNKVALVSSDADMLPVLFQAEADKRKVYYLREMTNEGGAYAQYHARLLGQYCKQVSW